jgi:hypothetical protein
MENKQTAVEWLVDQYAKAFKIPVNAVMQEPIQQALAMERIQVIYAYDDGANERHNDPVTGEQYYNEQYGK